MLKKKYICVYMKVTRKIFMYRFFNQFEMDPFFAKMWLEDCHFL